MTKPASPLKRQANRRNALRSTGPKTQEGRRRSSLNSLSHGLTVPLQVGVHDPLVVSIVGMIEQEGLDSQTGFELAAKILEYERNLAHQRELFLQDLLVGLSYQLPTQQAQAQGVRELFGTEIDMFDDYLDWERFNKRQVPDKDLKFISNSKLKMQKLWIRMDTKKQKDKIKQVKASLRYLKRSSNQLMKTLKSLGNAQRSPSAS